MFPSLSKVDTNNEILFLCKQTILVRILIDIYVLRVYSNAEYTF